MAKLTVRASATVYSTASEQQNHTAGSEEYLGSSYRWLLTFEHSLDLTQNTITGVTLSTTSVSRENFSVNADVGAFVSGAKASVCSHAIRAVENFSQYAYASVESGYYTHTSSAWSAAAVELLQSNSKFLVWLHVFDSSTQTGGNKCKTCSSANSTAARKPTIILTYDAVAPTPPRTAIAYTKSGEDWVGHPIYGKINGVWREIDKARRY